MLALLNSGQQCWDTYLLVLGIVVLVIIVLWILGKIFPGKAFSAGGNALMRAEVFFNPSREKLIEAKEREEREDEESGDPPQTGAEL